DGFKYTWHARVDMIRQVRQEQDGRIRQEARITRLIQERIQGKYKRKYMEGIEGWGRYKSTHLRKISSPKFQ
ncbi:hypothetical protein, partial [Alteromonas stellipolaris]|uniref:hypothetical protein n=1 Tax=Alteromonas stellipolaris TaxID=233316 RepID=UPI001D9DCA2F